MTRKLDLAFEALEEVTNSNRHIERGKLNTALEAIKAAWKDEGGMPEDLPDEIRRRAEAYRAKWPNMTLSPIPLASHWKRIFVEGQQLKSAQQLALDELRKENQ